MTDPAQARLRLDKWLWYARVVKSRTLAQKLIASGAVRINSTRVTQSDFLISPEMVLTLTVRDRLRILKIRACGTRRGPAAEARALYLDLSPELPKSGDVPSAFVARLPGSGRPTKKERRQTDRLQG